MKVSKQPIKKRIAKKARRIAQPSPPSKNVVLSVRPPHAQNIISGAKTVELRRRFNQNLPKGTLVFIYASSPTRAFTGSAKIKKIEYLKITDIWKRYSAAACITKKEFDIYFAGLKWGYAIIFANSTALKAPIELSILKADFNFRAPQSYQYAPMFFSELMAHDQSKNTD